jgi:hypothetical protein
MLSKIRIVLLSILLLVALCQLPQVKALYGNIHDALDNRPAVHVLFVGNSRTYYNAMPDMVRSIADSAHSPKKYLITSYAVGGAKLEDHWNDPAVQDLLHQQWDYVVLQGGSSEQINDHMNASFQEYGAKLVAIIKARGAMPVLFVAWKCADSYYPQLGDIAPYFYGMIQSGYSQLAQTSGASSVNVGRVWERVAAASALPLMVDGNHPTVRGSYLAALMFYRFFSGDDLAHVTYAPDGVAPDDVILL